MGGAIEIPTLVKGDPGEKGDSVLVYDVIPAINVVVVEASQSIGFSEIIYDKINNLSCWGSG